MEAYTDLDNKVTGFNKYEMQPVLKTNKGTLYNIATVIFGAGSGGRMCLDWLTSLGIGVLCFIDNSGKIQNLEGYSVFLPNDLKQIKDVGQIIIANTKYYSEMIQQLEEMNLPDKVNIFNWGLIYSDEKKDLLLSNVWNTHYEKKCLMLYITIPFLKRIQLIMEHQNVWQVYTMAEIIGELGYDVDVTRYDDEPELFVGYDLIIDMLPQDNAIYRYNMNSECKRIAYLTTSNPAVNNDREMARINYLEKRKGQRISSERVIRPLGKVVEQFNAFFLVGNEESLNTYNGFNLPATFIIHNHGYPMNIQFDIRKKKNNKFLFIAGGGAVHKGLDILLEVFSGNELIGELYVCGNIDNEKDFCALYKEELGEDNIHMMGYIDVAGELFQSLAEQCSYMIMPSCAEGMPGSVLLSMSAGLIPIVSRECGLSDEEAIIIDNCTVERVTAIVMEYGKRTLDWIFRESERIQSIAKKNYMPGNYIASLKHALDVVL